MEAFLLKSPLSQFSWNNVHFFADGNVFETATSSGIIFNDCVFEDGTMDGVLLRADGTWISSSSQTGIFWNLLKWSQVEASNIAWETNLNATASTVTGVSLKSSSFDSTSFTNSKISQSGSSEATSVVYGVYFDGLLFKDSSSLESFDVISDLVSNTVGDAVEIRLNLVVGL